MVRKLTVEQVLVLLVVVEVSAELLHLIDTELCGIDLLGSQAVVGQLAAHQTAGLSSLVVLNPHLLEVSTLDNMVPFAIGLAVVLLGRDALGLLHERLHGIRGQQRDLFPDGLGIGSELAKRLLEGRGQRLKVAAELDSRLGVAEDLLVLEGHGRRGSAQHEGGSRQPHCG